MGKLIVIDGLDGCGKSTQLERVSAYLSETGKSYKQICFPDYDKPASTLVKMYLAGDFGTTAEDVNAYAASSFYAVERFASFKQYWQKDYRDGMCILTARYTTSNAIHQMSKLDMSQWDEYLAWLDRYEYERLELPKPDLVLYLDMPLDISQKLLRHRYDGDDTKKDIHESNLRYLENCRKAALYAADKQGWQVITCGENGEPLDPAVITQRLIEHIEGVFSV